MTKSKKNLMNANAFESGDENADRRSLEKATGVKNPHLQKHLVEGLLSTLWVPADASEEKINELILAAVSTLREIEPKDGLEGMLAVQIVAAHHAALECSRRAMLSNQTFEGRDQNLKYATKMMSLCERLISALDKHRGKGHQKVTVKHVHVGPGGQAIVGNVERSADA